MILINFASILGKKRLKISKVITETKISRPTLTALYYNSGKGINFDTLNALCGYLQVQPGDLIKYYPVDVDEINVNFIDCSCEVMPTPFETREEIATDITFEGTIKFIQKHLPNLNFWGYLSSPSLIGETYSLSLEWGCTKEKYYQMADEDAWEEIENQICQTIIDECPYETGFSDNDFSIDSISISFNANKQPPFTKPEPPNSEGHNDPDL